MLKIGTLALFSTSRLGVSMLAMMSPKDGVICIGLYRENAWVYFLLFIFIWLNVLAVQVLNKSNKIFLNAYIYIYQLHSLIHKMARLADGSTVQPVPSIP